MQGHQKNSEDKKVYIGCDDKVTTLKRCSNSISKKGRPFLNVRVFELYKYTSNIFDSFVLSLPSFGLSLTEGAVAQTTYCYRYSKR